MATKIFLYLICAFGVNTLHLVSAQPGILPVTDENTGQCLPLEVPDCTNLGYQMAYLPNFRGHTRQNDAVKEFNDFIPLITNNCSSVIREFLCGFYFPFCDSDPMTGRKVILHPCRSICEYITPSCVALIEQDPRNLSWPEFFNCSLDSFAERPNCFGPPLETSTSETTDSVSPTEYEGSVHQTQTTISSPISTTPNAALKNSVISSLVLGVMIFASFF